MSKDDEDIKKKRLEAKELKIISMNKIKALSTDSDWNLLEELIQEVMATYIVRNPEQKNPSVRKMRMDVQSEIKLRYKEQEELRDILLEALPSEMTLGKWIKKPKWNEAVWNKVRSDGLFTKERRSKMINALFERGLNKSDNAAKIWLTLSGDYSDKIDVTSDKTVEKFREINQVLLNNKKD